MIKITEKDLLFVIINISFFFTGMAYVCTDFIAGLAQVMAAADPQYATIEGGLSLIRAFAYFIVAMVGCLVFACDMWWIIRLVREERTKYYRKNL